jgi:hypothetical protein
MLPVSSRTERLATLIAIAAGWLLILAYLVMLLANLISAPQEGASGNLLARVFSFAGLSVEQPWLEAYPLANVLTLALFFSLATRALLGDILSPCLDEAAHMAVVAMKSIFSRISSLTVIFTIAVVSGGFIAKS